MENVVTLLMFVGILFFVSDCCKSEDKKEIEMKRIELQLQQIKGEHLLAKPCAEDIV